MKPIEFTATVSKDAPPALMNALGQMAVHAAAMQIPTEPTMTNSPNTPTPRTDAEIEDASSPWSVEYISVAFARALETELSAALALCGKLADALRKMHDETLSVGEGHDGCCHCPRCFAEAALAEFDRVSRSSQ